MRATFLMLSYMTRVTLLVGVKVVRGDSNMTGVVIVLAAIYAHHQSCSNVSSERLTSEVCVKVRVVLCMMINVVDGVGRPRQLHAEDSAELVKLASTSGTLFVPDTIDELLEAPVGWRELDVLVMEAAGRLVLLILRAEEDGEEVVFLVDVIEVNWAFWRRLCRAASVTLRLAAPAPQTVVVTIRIEALYQRNSFAIIIYHSLS
jgi:hypothetical protein